MRGTDVHQEGLFSYLSPESRIPQRHPLRPVREMVDIALSELSGQFESMYSDTGRRSIPPEKLLRALLLQILYSIRSERMLAQNDTNRRFGDRTSLCGHQNRGLRVRCGTPAYHRDSFSLLGLLRRTGVAGIRWYVHQQRLKALACFVRIVTALRECLHDVCARLHD